MAFLAAVILGSCIGISVWFIGNLLVTWYEVGSVIEEE